jgi:anti-sigma regulatory factor (Ser/Thr protein kinase)/anti-anti-sigma regulatory factor
VSDLRCVLESSSPVAVLRASGRLGPATSVELRAALHKALAGHPEGIAVDVSALVADDDVALTVFSGFASSAAGSSACPVVLYAPSPALGAALDRLAIARTVPVYPSRTEALAGIAEAPPVRRYHRRLSSTPAAAALARETVAEACKAWSMPHLRDDAEIVVTELVANAVRHASGDLRLTVTRGQRFLHLSVRDGSPVAPVLRRPDPGSVMGGRGLVLVEALASGWGSTPTAGGKVVWATLRLR